MGRILLHNHIFITQSYFREPKEVSRNATNWKTCMLVTFLLSISLFNWYFIPTFSIRILYTIAAIYSSSFNVRYTAQKTQSYNWFLKLNIHYLYFCLFVRLFAFVFAYFLSYWDSFAVTILAMKIKRYVHVSYMRLFDYLGIYNKTYITYLHIQKIKIKPYENKNAALIL